MAQTLPVKRESIQEQKSPIEMLSWDDNDDEVLEESHERKEMQNSLKKPLNFASLSSASPFSSDFKKLEGSNKK